MFCAVQWLSIAERLNNVLMSHLNHRNVICSCQNQYMSHNRACTQLITHLYVAVWKRTKTLFLFLRHSVAVMSRCCMFCVCDCSLACLCSVQGWALSVTDCQLSERSQPQLRSGPRWPGLHSMVTLDSNRLQNWPNNSASTHLFWIHTTHMHIWLFIVNFVACQPLQCTISGGSEWELKVQTQAPITSVW